MNLVHPDGMAFSASNEELQISFEPSPDYSGIAKAGAGKLFGKSKEGLYAARVVDPEKLSKVLDEAVRAVQDGRGAVVEVVLDEQKSGRMGF